MQKLPQASLKTGITVLTQLNFVYDGLENLTVYHKDLNPGLISEASSTSFLSEFIVEKHGRDFDPENNRLSAYETTATQIDLQREVSLKLYPKELAQEILPGSLVASHLNHPNVIPIYRVFFSPNGREIERKETLRGVNSFDAGTAFKRLEGMTWREKLCSDRKKLKSKTDLKDYFESNFQILTKVGEAIAFAHSQGYVNCNIKPDNIFIGEFNEVLTLDWNCAVDLHMPDSREKTRTNFKKDVDYALGTPCYRPPELSKGVGEEIGQWTDTYLLGALVYELVTGFPPNSEHEKIVSKCQEKIIDFSSVSMNRDPKRRYQSVSQFFSALNKAKKQQESVDLLHDIDGNLEVAISTLRTFKENPKSVNSSAIFTAFRSCLNDCTMAIELWPENHDLEKLRNRTLLYYSQLNLFTRNFKMAKSLLVEITDSSPQLTEHEIELERAERSAQSFRRKQRQIIRAFPILIIGLIVPLTYYLNEIDKKATLKEIRLEVSLGTRLLDQAREEIAPSSQLEDIDNWLQLVSKFASNRQRYSTSLNDLRLRALSTSKSYEPRYYRLSEEIEAFNSWHKILSARVLGLKEQVNSKNYNRNYLVACKMVDECRAISEMLTLTKLSDHDLRGQLRDTHRWLTGYGKKLRLARRKLGELGEQNHQNINEEFISQAHVLQSEIWKSINQFVEEAPSHEKRLKKVAASSEETRIQLQGSLGTTTYEYSDPYDKQLGKSLNALTRIFDKLDGIKARVQEDRTKLLKVRKQFKKDKSKWESVCKQIAADSTYGGLQLRPTLGLSPLGKNPQTELYEFYHVLSGEAPSSFPKITFEEDTGIIMILIPAMSFDMGEDFDRDPRILIGEQPKNRVNLGAYFISKYETSQAQWLRLTGSNPSYTATEVFASEYFRRSAVERVSLDDCLELGRRFDLDIPTAAQWENAARAGTTTMWYCGDDESQISTISNQLDESFREMFDSGIGSPSDGFPVSCPVAEYSANPFGLYGVLGNVFELCSDSPASYHYPTISLTGQRLNFVSSNTNLKGGGFSTSAIYGRSSASYRTQRSFRNYRFGIRFCLNITD